VRILEILITGLNLAGLLLILWMGTRPQGSRREERRNVAYARVLYAAVLGAVLGMHLIWEGAHWQMIPDYLASLLILLLMIRRRPRQAWTFAGSIGGLLLVAASCAASYILPIIHVPDPTGPYAVGTRILNLTDNSRAEDAEPNSIHRRELVVQIWYPAEASNYPRAPYRRRSETSLASSYQSVSWTHSRYDAPIAGASLPIILYNPGWNGRRTQDTLLTEDLASQGYVVVAIDHPYNSGPVALPDGRLIRPVPAPELTDDSTSKDTIYAVIRKEVLKETDDTLFVLGQLRQMNRNAASPFYQHLDMARVGAMGYSIGGSVAADCAYRDPAIRAVESLDAPFYGDARTHAIQQPILVLNEELTHTTPAERAHMSFGQRRDTEMDEYDYRQQMPWYTRSGSYFFTVHGTLHTSFQDVILTSPLPSISTAGKIPPSRLVPILRQYTLAFFDQTLRGLPSPLLASQGSPFPEVERHAPVSASAQP
jgi:predicted dienelactone hydrolase